MSKIELSRRDFLLRVSAMGAVAAGSGTLLAACGGGQTETAAPEAAAPEAPAAEPEQQAAAVDCSDVSGLTDAEKQMRTQLQYVDETPDAAKRCDGCALYTAPEGDAACGGCQIVKGPIAPGGWCVSWAAKPS